MTAVPTGSDGPAILGTGFAVPQTTRLNNDPIFARLNSDPTNAQRYFNGYAVRHVLAPDESLPDLMARACDMALKDAGVTPEEIDLVIGDGSIGPYAVPNVISEVHQKLGLPERAWPIALSSAFSQFNASCVLADALIRAGRARYVLVALGDDWTRHVDYATAQAASAGDGAAACVIGPRRDTGQFALVDYRTKVDTQYFGSMFMSTEPVDQAVADALDPQTVVFQITPKGLEGFSKFAQAQGHLPVLDLLSAHGVDPAAACLITHQASKVLMDTWHTNIRPGLYLNTLDLFANIVHSAVPFNLAFGLRKFHNFTQDWVVTLSLGPDMHISSALFRRNGP
jgi:3-oxoacyl-[acyl-carrier-protein] synthase-3